MSESTDKLQQVILQLHKESQKMSLKMNMKKIKMMFNYYIQGHEIEIHGEVI